VSPDNLLQQRSRRATAEIVEAARRRFGSAGYAATSIDDIAADTGRTKGAVYHHFRDKSELFREVFLTEQRHIADVIVGRTTGPPPSAMAPSAGSEADADAGPGATGGLGDGIAAYLSTIAGSPTAARITLIDAPTVLGWEEWRSCGDGPFRSLLRAALGAVDRAAAGRLAERHDLDLLTELLLGAITEAAYNTSTDPHPRRAANRYATQLRRLVDGLVAPPPRRS
jgi:AcrR family transcriptional regulator